MLPARTSDEDAMIRIITAAAVAVLLTVAPVRAASNAPPDAFRGIKWDSALPPVEQLKKTALSGCASVVEQAHLIDTSPCSHIHLDTDEMDLFTQRRNVAPIFGVAGSEQLLSWSYRKFWSGKVFIQDYKDVDLAKLRDALVSQYGPPTLDDIGHHRTEWNWPNDHLMIRLGFDPVPKPEVGNPTSLHTTISLLFTKTE
jgi:hypothetical protein